MNHTDAPAAKLTADCESQLPVVNIAAYHFVTLDRLPERRGELQELSRRLNLKGTVLLSPEGINLFMAGTRSAIDELLAFLRDDPLLADIEVKESFSATQPFNRMLVRLKQEIIAFGVDGVDPRVTTSPKLPPRTLKQWLDEGRPLHLLDTRNDYEVKLGTFHGATLLDINNFRDFPQAVAALPESMKDEPVVMFCTGGIRCEKAGPFMEQQGFRQIYQLEGGILRYFEECGGAHYDGDCFVFDQRVALDPGLRETSAALCFACLAPLSDEDQQSPLYVPGEACPHCYRTSDRKMAETIARRQSDIRRITTPLPGSKPYNNVRPINVPGRFDGRTVLDVLAEWHPHITRDEWRQTILDGHIICGGSPPGPVSEGDIVRGGQRLDHLIPETVEPDINPDIEVLFEDESLVVVNKPAPLPMHPCGRFHRNTLEWILNEAWQPERLRPAHRLDASTSGIVVMTRSRRIASLLQPQFEQREVAKKYLACVHGHPALDEFECDAPISEQVGVSGLRTISPDGLPSLTRFTVIRRNADNTSLVEAIPVTGRTNQIRLHLWHLDHPVVGDPSWLPGHAIGSNCSITADASPMCLHSLELTLRHPDSNDAVTFRATPPAWAGVTGW